MGLRAAVRHFAGSRPLVTLLALAVVASLAWASAGDDEAVVIRLIAYLGETDYELDLDPAADPAVEILPCYPTNRPFLGAEDDPYVRARNGATTVFTRQWVDPSRYQVESPDEGDTSPFTPPTQVTFELTLPWINGFDAVDYYPNRLALTSGIPRIQVSLADAISSYIERGGRERTDVACQDPEALDDLRDAVDTESRIDEALDAIGVDDPR